MADYLHDLTFRTVLANGSLHAPIEDVKAMTWITGPDGSGGTISFLKGGLVRVPDEEAEDGTTPVRIEDLLKPKSVIAILKRAVEPYNGRIVLQEPKDDVIPDGDNQVEVVEWTFTWLGSRFAEAGSAWPTGDVAVPEVFTQAKPGVFLRQQWTAARAVGRDALLDVDISFTNDDDSAATPWDNLVSRTVEPGSSILSQLEWLHARGAAHYRMEEDTLAVYNPGQGVVDWTDPDDPGNTLGEALYLHAGYELLEGPRQGNARELANRVLVKGDEDRYQVAEDATSITAYGPRETVRNASGVSDPADLTALAEAYVQLYSQPRFVIAFAVILGEGKDPLDTFNVGDSFWVRDMSIDGMPRRKVTCSKITLYLRGEEVSADIAVDDWLALQDQRLEALIQSMLDGAGEGKVPSRNALAPEAPVQVGTMTVTVVPPEAGSGGSNTIRLDGVFTWSGLDTDGVACGDLDKFLTRWKYGDHGWTELVIATDQTTFRINNLRPGRTITVQLGARDEAGNTTWTGDLV